MSRITDAIAQLKQAIDANDVERVKSLMTRNPALHRAPLGYGEDGPLTWVAECRVPREPPGAARLAMAAWMIEHARKDGPHLPRAARNDDLHGALLTRRSGLGIPRSEPGTVRNGRRCDTGFER
jgi:hypothetical protein